MIGEHPEADAEEHYDFGCTWYSDHGPFYSGLQFAWFAIGLPCFAATVLALLSTCGLISWARVCDCTPRPVADAFDSPYASTHYGPLIDISSSHMNVDDHVHRWIQRGAYGAMLYSVLLFVLAAFMALHANNEADFSFLLDSVVAFFMFLSKLVVAICARVVHQFLSPTSQQVAKRWIVVLAVSKALAAVSALVLCAVYLVLAIRGVDANRGDGTRRRLQDYHDDSDHGPTQDEKAELCAAGFFMVWSFLITLVSQSMAGFAFASIYANAAHLFGNRQIFRTVVSCWWGILVGCTCGVGTALWLGAGLCVFPALDVSPLRMMGFFYSGGAVNQMLAGSAMLCGNQLVRNYWAKQNAGTSVQLPVSGTEPTRDQAAQADIVGTVVGQPIADFNPNKSDI